MLSLLLLAAHLNLTAIVPLQPGDVPPPWWVGGRLVWPFAVETRTLIPLGDLLDSLTPLLAIASALSFLTAAVALLRRWVPQQGFRWLVVAGAAFSLLLQIIWISAWAVLPLLLDAILLWAVLRRGVTVESLRAETPLLESAAS